jgi:two-component system sensor histidine kinase CpxA
LTSLFPRFFVSFCVASTLVAAAFALIHATANPPDRVERRANLAREALRLQAAAVLARDDAHAEATLARFRESTGASLYLFREDGSTLIPKEPPEPVREVAARVRTEGDLEVERDAADLVGFVVPGTRTVAVGRVARTPAWARALGTDTLPLRLLVIVVASGVVSFALARHLTRPIRSLRRATQRIASGDLSTRVVPEVGTTDAELEALARDFDVMTERVESLLVSQKRLLTDVSHELNSPLARLRVALELARRRAGPDANAPLDRIEREAERLGALVAEILTLASLEQKGLGDLVTVDLRALVDEVARDADYEATSRGAHVRVARADDVSLAGAPEALRRAVENVVRNAVRFAQKGTEVAIELTDDGADVHLTVRDHGPGVPERELRAIFQPLHRVEADRARETGGAGLGLAIAERAVVLHGGTIEAENAEGGGLRVRMRLPRVLR